MTKFGIVRGFLLGAVALAPALALAQRPGPRDDGRRPPFGDRDRPIPPLMAALDTDHDGELSAKELSNASRALASLDHNNDGKLDRSEIMPRPGPEGGPRRGDREGGPRPEAGPRDRDRGPREGGPRDGDAGRRPEGGPRDGDGGRRPEGGPRPGMEPDREWSTFCLRSSVRI